MFPYKHAFLRYKRIARIYRSLFLRTYYRKVLLLYYQTQKNSIQFKTLHHTVTNLETFLTRFIRLNL